IVERLLPKRALKGVMREEMQLLCAGNFQRFDHPLMLRPAPRHEQTLISDVAGQHVLEDETARPGTQEAGALKPEYAHFDFRAWQVGHRLQEFDRHLMADHRGDL